MIANGIALTGKDQIVLTTNKGIVLVELQNPGSKNRDSIVKIADMKQDDGEDQEFFQVLDFTHLRVMGYCADKKQPSKHRKIVRIFQVTFYDDSFSFEMHPKHNVHLDQIYNFPKMVSKMNFVSYMSNENTVRLVSNPFDNHFERETEFKFEFCVHDYCTLSTDKVIGISQYGWIGVLYEDNNHVVQTGAGFQLELDDEEYVNYIQSDFSSDLVVIATFIGVDASRLIFCEIINAGIEIFLVQSHTFYFSSSKFNRNMNRI